MDLELEIGKVILALIVLINPFSALSLFLELTRHYTPQDRRRVAQISCFSVFVVIAFFAISGNFLLKFFGISVGSFQVGGGILVFLIAVSMVSSGNNVAKPDIGTSEKHEIQITHEQPNPTEISIVPIAIPMMIGPGGMSTVVILTSSTSQTHSFKEILAVIIAGVVIAIFCYVILLMAGRVSKLLGDTGLTVLNRIMGLLLAAVAVEIVVSGLKSLFPLLK